MARPVDDVSKCFPCDPYLLCLESQGGWARAARLAFSYANAPGNAVDGMDRDVERVTRAVFYETLRQQAIGLAPVV